MMDHVKTLDLLQSGTALPQLIGGRWTAAAAGLSKPVVNPATGNPIGEISYGSQDDAVLAADAAREAFGQWSSLPARTRSDILRDAAEILLGRLDPIARLLSMETGKRLSESVGEIRFSAEYLRWFSEEIRRPRGEVLSYEDPNRRHFTISKAAGVAITLTPWNFPVSIQARKIAPALAAGCTVVARPSEKAPVAVSELFRALDDAGLPAGAANLIFGPAGEQSTALIAHEAVRVVSFTGSTEVGSSLMRLSSDRILHCALELGGDAPFIIFADADIDKAVEGLLIAKFRNNGQSCIGANRIFVENSIFDQLSERLARELPRFRIGDPLGEKEPDLGPLIDHQRVVEVENLASQALAQGGEWIGGSPEIPDGPCYTRPGFIIGAPADRGLAKTEVFGPVSALFGFDSEDEAVALANDTNMGLAGYLYTSDQSRIWRLSEQVDVGILGVNHPLPSVAFAPLGGSKSSGLGREGAKLGLDEFMETRYISLGIDGAGHGR